jgi:DNA-3-methyladenine glycosylase I
MRDKKAENSQERCGWCKDHTLLMTYHDVEWGVPLFDEQKLFEFILLEGAQAGLSWLTVLQRREHYREALDGFDPEKIARYNPKKIQALLQNPGLIRNRLKLESVVKNAQAFLNIQQQGLSFSDYLWQFVEGKSKNNQLCHTDLYPTTSKESDLLAKDLKKRGFTFVGTTICYAFMQATGMVNDHTTNCFRYLEILPEAFEI